MSEALTQYRALERRLIHTRWINGGYGSDAEDGLLELMDEVWWRLSDDERHALNHECPRSLVRSAPQAPAGHCTDVDVFSAPGMAVRVGSVA